MTTVQIEFPDELAKRLDALIEQGWVSDRNQAITEALRRFLEIHRPELMEAQVMDDVDWGLHGKS
jgi:metal-responsive CopG/Arc/MetJ family transcriptional regulator